MQEFSIMAKEAGICEATSEKVSNNADDEAFDKARLFLRYWLKSRKDFDAMQRTSEIRI